MNGRKACLADEQLERLAAGQPDEDALAPLAAHLETCEDCRRRFEELAGSGHWAAGRLELLRETAPVGEPALAEAMDRLKREGLAAADAEREAETGGRQGRFPFLAPSGQPGVLGRLGRYDVLDVLGRGGMGVVFRARDPWLNRIDAIKVLAPHLAQQPTARRRFLREAQAAAAVSHDHVVTIYAVDEWEGTPFIVMEYVEGLTLQERIQRDGPLELREILRIALQTAEGLAAAHAQGVIHRDVKPGNIMLQNGLERVKIADFGLARVADDAQLTQSGMLTGTPQYMAPEQARGGPVDHRSDLFSLGCVIYAMAAGRSPFWADSALAALRRVCDETPRPLREINADAPQWLEQMVERLLAKDPDERFQTAAEVADALRERLAELQQPTRADGRAAPRRQAAAQRAREGEPVGGGGEPSIAVLPLDNLSADPENEYFGDGLAEELINALTRVPGLRVVARSSAFQYKGQQLDVREVGRRLNATVVLEGSVRRAGKRVRITAQLIDVQSGYHVWSERFDRDLDDVFAVQDEIARTIVGQLKGTLESGGSQPLIRRHTEHTEAYHCYLRGRYYWNQRSPAAIEQAGRFFSKALELDPDYALAHAGLADCRVLMGIYSLSDQQPALEAARRSAQRALELDRSLPEPHTSLGIVQAIRDHAWSEAEQSFKRAIEWGAGYAPAHLYYVLTVLAPQGRWAEAAAEARRAQELDPVAAINNAAPGIVRAYQRRYEEAIAAFAAALESSPDNPAVNLWATAAYAGLGRWDEALAAVERARPFELLSLEQKTWILAAAGRRDEADACLAELRRLLRAGRREAALSIAKLEAVRGRTNEALDWLELAYEARAVGLTLLAVDPCFDGLRGEPRLRRLLERMNLPQAPVDGSRSL